MNQATRNPDLLTEEQRKEMMAGWRLIIEHQIKREQCAFYTYYPDDGPLRRELYAKHMECLAAGAVFKERLFMAANRVGKTEGVGAFEATCHLTGRYPLWWQGHRFQGPIEMWACGTNGETTRDIVQSKLLGPVDKPGYGMIPPGWVKHTSRRTHGLQGAIESAQIKHVNGGYSLVNFKAYEQGRKSFEGTAKHFIWCLAEGELVQMADGRVMPIEEVVVGDHVLSLDSDGRPVARRVTGTADQGHKATIALTTRHGSRVVVTPDHQVYWGYSRVSKQRADETRRVAQIRPGWWPEVTRDRAEAWYVWAALVVAEGTVSQRKVTSGDVESLERAASMLPPEARVRKKVMPAGHVPDWHLVWPAFWQDMPPGVAHEKQIPSWVWTSSREKATLFLRWLYQGDGWASGHTIGYATTSERLAQELVILLSRLGIRASLRAREPVNPRWRRQWWVQIAKARDVLLFCEHVGIEGKSPALARVRAEANRRAASNLKRLKRHAPAAPPRPVVERAAVRRTEPAGDRRVFDITVEGEHRFLAGTALISNCDEEPPLDCYTEMLYRTLTTKGLVLTTFTPMQGFSEMVRSFLEPDSDEAAESKVVIQAGWDDVPHLDASEKRRLLATTPIYMRAARTKGEPTMGSGAIYPIPESDILVPTRSIPDTWPKGYGLDVGWNRTAALFVTQEPGTGVYIAYDEHYMSVGEPSSHARGIRARGEWLVGVIDPNSRGRSQHDGRQLLESYRALGLNLEEADNAVEAGLLDCFTLLVEGRFKVQEHLANYRAEYRKYHRDEQGKIVKAHDHLMDAFRYFVKSGRDRMTIRPQAQRKSINPAGPSGDGRSWMGS